MNIALVSRFVLPALLATACLGADFTYTDQTEITGGSMKSLMNLAARFSKQAGAPITTVHRYKDHRMGTFTGDQVNITDIQAETITMIDTKKKEYSVITFAEMAEAMKAMMAKMSGAKKPAKSDVKMEWKISADNTGKTKEVAGVNAKHTILKMQAQGTDPQSGQSGTMAIATDIWTGKVPGYETAQKFNMELGKKLMVSANVNPMMAAQLGESMMSGMGEVAKKMSELDGMPLQSVTRMGMGNVPPASEAPTAAAAPESQGPTAKEALGGALKGLGGFGRFGRKQPKAEEPPPAQPPEANQAAASGILMETTTTVMSFSSEAIDPSLLSVPSGFKQVEHPMKKMR
ncbi:MAG: hypothetical protein FJW20_15920 [Acidimicrobiia bacterium]|nr:hypothetical protein [Acidimicrobiia bacterium]